MEQYVLRKGFSKEAHPLNVGRVVWQNNTYAKVEWHVWSEKKNAFYTHVIRVLLTALQPLTNEVYLARRDEMERRIVKEDYWQYRPWIMPWWAPDEFLAALEQFNDKNNTGVNNAAIMDMG